MISNFCLSYTFYYNFLLIKSDNNKLADIFLKVFINSNNSFFIIKICFWVFTLNFALVLVFSILVNKYINKKL